MAEIINIFINRIVREAGLEPARLVSATPSRWCVCQFHHSRKMNHNLLYSAKKFNLIVFTGAVNSTNCETFSIESQALRTALALAIIL